MSESLKTHSDRDFAREKYMYHKRVLESKEGKICRKLTVRYIFLRFWSPNRVTLYATYINKYFSVTQWEKCSNGGFKKFTRRVAAVLWKAYMRRKKKSGRKPKDDIHMSFLLVRVISGFVYTYLSNSRLGTFPRDIFIARHMWERFFSTKVSRCVIWEYE